MNGSTENGYERHNQKGASDGESAPSIGRKFAEPSTGKVDPKPTKTASGSFECGQNGPAVTGPDLRRAQIQAKQERKTHFAAAGRQRMTKYDVRDPWLMWVNDVQPN